MDLEEQRYDILIRLDNMEDRLKDLQKSIENVGKKNDDNFEKLSSKIELWIMASTKAVIEANENKGS